VSDNVIPLRAGHDAADEAPERELGLALLTRFQSLLRAARLYDETNRAYRAQIDEFLATVASAREAETVLVGMGDAFYVNGVRLRPTATQVALFRAVQDEFTLRGLGALRLRRGLAGGEVTSFMRLFVAARDAEQGERLPELVAAAGIQCILPVRASELRNQAPEAEDADRQEAQDERARAREMFERAVAGTKSLLVRTARTGKPALRLARRLIQPVVDSVQKSEFSIVGMTALKNHDEYTFAHCVNVSVLSVAMGHTMGLSRAALANLGVAGLLHDLGKLAVPTDVLRKPGALSPEEWQTIQRHPLEGVKLVSRMSGLSTLMLDTMRVSFEHHLCLDGSGYPALPGPRFPAAFTRIVTAADVFDAMTAHRAYRWRPFTGHEALQNLMSPDRVRYDAAVLWALVRSVGLYPAGTLLATASGHVVLSLSPNPTDVHRPFCRVLERPDGTRPEEAEAETWDPMPPHEQVARVLAPEEWPGDTEKLLAA
jgi:HD-GYP domain-containing protein (c-di-GMP phosphodiesterase class II)